VKHWQISLIFAMRH